jgi:hypothetical protein
MTSTTSNKFPVKLFNILQEAEKTPYIADIVSWMPDGKSFKVHNKDKFSKSILPSTFGTNVYKSYQRNLHFWGFQNIRKGPSKGVCSHPSFVKDRPDLLAQMRRVRAPSKANENDFGSPTLNNSNVNAQHQQFSQAAPAVAAVSQDSSYDDGSSRNGNQIPAFVFGRPSRWVVSPSMTSQASSHLMASLPNLMSGAGNDTTTAALLLLQQQQQQGENNKDSGAVEQLQQQQLPYLAEALLVRQLMDQQQQQDQQQRRLEEILALAAAGNQQQQQPYAGMSSDAITLALLAARLLQGGGGADNQQQNLLSMLL